VAFTALSLWHVDRSLQSLGDLVGIIGIDDQRFFEVLSGAGEARQDKHSGIMLVLRSNIFLGDQVHSVAQRGDETDMTSPEQRCQRISSNAAKTTKDRETGETHRERGFDLELQIPLFDFGEVRIREAEATYMQCLGFVQTGMRRSVSPRSAGCDGSCFNANFGDRLRRSNASRSRTCATMRIGA
jgi:hypothetical protein